MKLDRHIKLCEGCIARLEECRRTGSGNLSQVNKEIEEAYQQLALLKIRQSMNMVS